MSVELNALIHEETGEDTALFCLHGVRLFGGADTARVAARFGMDYDATQESLLDFEAVGWLSRTEFGGIRAWSLTEAGRAENERQLAVELDACRGREVVARAYDEFLELNGRFLRAVTDWQLRPVCDELARVLTRFDGYGDRYGQAVQRFQAGQMRWVDAIERRLLPCGVDAVA